MGKPGHEPLPGTMSSSRRARQIGPVLAALALLAQVAGAAEEQPVGGAHGDAIAPNQSIADRPLTLAGVIEGMVHYTRWPAEAKPIQLCVLGDGAGAQELLKSGTLGPPQCTIAVQRTTAATLTIRGCHALYFASSSVALQRNLLTRLGADPVLTIGEGPAFCSDGGMFCVESVGASIRFGANLDAISRSGLRTNPQVLWLARPRRNSGP